MFAIVKVTNYSNNDPLIEKVATTDTFQEVVDFIEQTKDRLAGTSVDFDETRYDFYFEEAYFCYTDLKDHFKVCYKSLNLEYVYKPKSIYSDRNE